MKRSVKEPRRTARTGDIINSMNKAVNTDKTVAMKEKTLFKTNRKDKSTILMSEPILERTCKAGIIHSSTQKKYCQNSL